ncbi:hypothetical protein HanRHA438_Chr07g0317101 [Helianthus annuus]|nr:hypothetical protein HanIR_Chr07g0332551 [Helianthus annuus]KAJ0909035.1 hypothetical protein HanRHA438_Chr07g0317101 [Helianthus annuus]
MEQELSYFLRKKKKKNPFFPPLSGITTLSADRKKSYNSIGDMNVTEKGKKKQIQTTSTLCWGMSSTEAIRRAKPQL